MGGLRGVWRRSTAGKVWRHGGELELLHRSMGFAALGLVTLMPLLVVVAAAAPFQRTGFAQWVVDGMGLSPHSSESVRRLFAAPRKVLSTTSALSLASLAFFGLSFASSVETGYRKVWELPPSPWHSEWRRAVWLAALTAYLFAEAQSGTVLRHGWRQGAARMALTLSLGLVFFWWGQRFVLAGRISGRSALVCAVFTMLGLVGLRVFSSLVFSPLIVTNAVTYGPVGTVLVVQCWLIGAGFVIFGGALLGRHVYEAYGSAPADGADAHAGGVGGAEPGGAGADDAALAESVGVETAGAKSAVGGTADAESAGAGSADGGRAGPEAATERSSGSATSR